MALQADYINASLNTFLKALITAYSRIPWAMDKAVSKTMFAKIVTSDKSIFTVRICLL